MSLGALRGDGVILYGDEQSLLEALSGILANGGLMVEATAPPPLRTPADYALSFGNVKTASLRAEAVFAAGTNVGFQVLELEQVRQQLEQLRDQLAAMAAPPAPPPQRAKVAHAPSAAQLANRHRPTVEVFGVEWDPDDQEAAPSAPEPPQQPVAVAEAAPQAEAKASRFSHVGPLVPLITVDEVVGSQQQRAGITEGEALPAVQALIAAAELVVPCTVQIGSWTLQIARRHVVAVVTPDGETGLHHLTARRIPRTEIEDLIAEAASKRVTIEYLALERQIAERQDLAKGFNTLLMNRTREIMQLTEGRYQINSGFALQMGVAIPFERLGLEAVRRSLHTLRPGAAREWFAERIMGKSVAPRGAPLDNVARYTGEKRYHRWIQRLAGRLPLRELFRQAPMAKEIAYELIIGLMALDRCELVKSSADEAQDPVELLNELLKQITGQEPFSTLSLHWTVHADEIEERIKERRGELSPRGELAQVSALAAKLSKQALALSEAAYAELSGPQKRGLARQRTASEAELITARGLLSKQAELARLRGRQEKHRRLVEVLAELGRAAPDKVLRLDKLR
jgi:hypothetical protein